MVNNKYGLFVFRRHSYLVVAREGIYEGEEFMIESYIDQLVDPRQKITIFGIGFVHISKINAHTSLSVSLFYHHHIRKPVGVYHLFN